MTSMYTKTVRCDTADVVRHLARKIASKGQQLQHAETYVCVKTAGLAPDSAVPAKETKKPKEKEDNRAVCEPSTAHMSHFGTPPGNLLRPSLAERGLLCLLRVEGRHAQGVHHSSQGCER
jgi:hypothetical protein